MHLGGGRTWSQTGKWFRIAETGWRTVPELRLGRQYQLGGGFNLGYVQFHNYSWGKLERRVTIVDGRPSRRRAADH